jgi:hypothetical protein
MEGCYVLCGYQPRIHRNHAPFPETRSYNPTVRLELYCGLGKVVIHAEQWVKCRPAKEFQPRGDSPARKRAIYRAEHAGTWRQEFAALPTIGNQKILVCTLYMYRKSIKPLPHSWPWVGCQYIECRDKRPGQRFSHWCSSRERAHGHSWERSRTGHVKRRQ